MMEPNIIRLYIYRFSLNINTLRDPPEYLKIREVKEWHVKLLMKMFEGDGEGCEDYEELTAQFLVVCSVGKQELRLNASTPTPTKL